MYGLINKLYTFPLGRNLSKSCVVKRCHVKKLNMKAIKSNTKADHDIIEEGYF